MDTCKICGEKVTEEKHYFSKHKIKVADYFIKYFLKVDLYTGEPIPFKNKEQYLSTDFLNKDNLKTFLKNSPSRKAEDYCVNLLKRRKEAKNLIWTPTQVELRSILSPSIIYLSQLFGDYYKTCEQLGFKNKFTNPPNKIEQSFRYSNPDYCIFIDSREQRFLDLNYPVEIKKLEVGDYGLSSPEECGNIYIERKSISDMIGSLSSGLERFTKEIERAKAAGAYLIILVEENLNNALAFNSLPHVFGKTKVTPDYIFHIVRELTQKYPHIQFLFSGNRAESARLVKQILFSEGICRNFDLQLALDLKTL